MQDFDFAQILIPFAQILRSFLPHLPRIFLGHAAASPASTSLLYTTSTFAKVLGWMQDQNYDKKLIFKIKVIYKF